MNLPEERSSAQKEKPAPYFPPPSELFFFFLRIFSSMDCNRKIIQKLQDRKKKKNCWSLMEGEDGTCNGPRTPRCRGVTFPSGQEARANTMSSLREVKGLPRSFCGSNTELIA